MGLTQEASPVWLDRFAIEGYRGFSARAEIKLAKPDGQTPGSGLTIIVGANGSGKSTALEAIRFLQDIAVPVQMDDNRRNSAARGRGTITYVSSSGKKLTRVRVPPLLLMKARDINELRAFVASWVLLLDFGWKAPWKARPSFPAFLSASTSRSDARCSQRARSSTCGRKRP